MNLGKVYLSGPYSGIESAAPAMFNSAKEYILRNKLASSIWVPTENIPSSYNWEESMQICRKVLTPENVDTVVVIAHERTPLSKGVAEELQIAFDNKIDVVILFGNINNHRGLYNMTYFSSNCEPQFITGIPNRDDLYSFIAKLGEN